MLWGLGCGGKAHARSSTSLPRLPFPAAWQRFCPICIGLRPRSIKGGKSQPRPARQHLQVGSKLVQAGQNVGAGLGAGLEGDGLDVQGAEGGVGGLRSQPVLHQLGDETCREAGRAGCARLCATCSTTPVRHSMAWPHAFSERVCTRGTA